MTVAQGDLLTPGRVIRMRDRLWRVDYTDGQMFGATALDGRDNFGQRFHQELETFEQGNLPLPLASAVGDERNQRLLIDAQRFSLLHGTAPILGLQRSRAIPTDYQIVPLLMALGDERVRLLIADDVGTGKTIEAGLVISELMARGKVRRVLIVVPANLRAQWKEALDHFFHIDATIVSGTLLPSLERRLLPGKSVWSAQDVVIASVDYLKTKTAQVLAYDWDLVVIDEAHLCAMPHTFLGASPDMERWQFASAAADAARHLVLLTATPHNGYSDSYASLFRMLDPTLVRDTGDGPVINRQRARAKHVVQRQRSNIEDWYRQRGVKSPFPERRADEQIIDLDRAREMRALLDELNDYAKVLYAGASGSVDRWIAAHMQKRALSSPAALRKSIESRVRTIQKQAAVPATKKRVTEAREATADQVFAENDEQDAANLDQTQSSLDAAAELARLTQLAETAKKVTAAKDPKLQELLRLLPERMNAHPDARRVLVFTKFKDTLDYLADQLRSAASGKNKRNVDLHGVEVFAIHGQMSLAQRTETFSAFERSDRGVLVATDVISEGLNLQRACAELVHYELPWNPNRLEQRNGRVDRFQQPEPFVGIRTLVFDDAQDAALLYLIDKKAQQMRADYGFVPPFLANADILLHLSNPAAAYRDHLQTKKHQGQMALFNLFDDGPDTEPLEQVDDELSRLAEESLSSDDRLHRMRDESFYGQADISLATIEAALSRSRDEIGSPERIRDFVLANIRSLHGTVATSTDGTFAIPSPPAAIADAVNATGKYTFDPLVGMDDADVDIIDLAHPLARRLIDLTIDRAQMPDCEGRIAARISPAVKGTTAVAHVLFRYVAQGTPPVLLEEVVPIAYRLANGTPVDDALSLLDGPTGAGTKHPDDISEDAEDVLTDPTLEARLAAIATERAQTLAQRHADLSADWANGLDHVEVTSFDVLALTLLYKEVSA